VKDLILESFIYIPLPILWLFIFYFFIKSNFWKKFILYFNILILIITSLPITSTLAKKNLYIDHQKFSLVKKDPAYILVPTGGIGSDGYGGWHPSRESIKRVQFGKYLSEKYSIPIIIAGGGKNSVKEANLLADYFDYNFYFLETKSKNTFEMAVELKNQINLTDKPLLIATTPIHHLRTFLVLKKQNIEAMVPDEYIKNKRRVSYSILPSIDGYVEFNGLIYEYLGIAWYYLTNKI
jgi:uncharacterized SAM-binding protein YcdF (DUF218 family)